MWAALVPALNGYPLREFLNTVPVFNGRNLAEGVYVLQGIRTYGEGGDQQFAVAYAVPDGSLWWEYPATILKTSPNGYDEPRR